MINDSIWKFLLNMFSIFTENVYLNIMFYSLCFSLFMILLANKMKQKYIYYLPAFLFPFSVGYMVQRLPMIHEKIHRALSVTSSVIFQSEVYKEQFSEMAGFVPGSTLDIASYLYFLETPKICEPTMIYEKVFGTLGKMKTLWLLPDVVDTPRTMIFIIAIILIMGIIIFYKKHSIFIYAIQSCILLYAATVNNGMVCSVIILWFFGEIFLEGGRKTEPGSVSGGNCLRKYKKYHIN